MMKANIVHVAELLYLHGGDLNDLNRYNNVNRDDVRSIEELESIRVQVNDNMNTIKQAVDVHLYRDVRDIVMEYVNRVDIEVAETR